MARRNRLTVGSTFAERFLVKRFLAQGAMGGVYLVEDREANEDRALKIMHSELLADPKLAERFEQEATIGAGISSPHVVRVHACGVEARGGMRWLLMEYYPGQHLGAYLEEREPLPQGHVEAILRQLFDAVSAAHAINIVHRDLKPENILVSAARDKGAPPDIKVADFGVAKVLRDGSVGGTADGLGTPLWTAPEQTREQQKIRPAADVWALGLITFRVLVGHVYWRAMSDPKASPVDIARELLHDAMPPASQRARELDGRKLPAGFDAWFARCAARAADTRFPNATDAYTALEPILRARARPATPRTLVLVLVLVLVAVGLAASAAFITASLR